ncbi:MAG TPA: M1 family metallopeptidase [Candidatus Saccharimonadales bacterium]|nr:M1 family metallopeptidase [Candidatus Saccharimonadales bacterium]
MAKGVPRLIKQFKPNHYILDLTLDKANQKFSGSVIIAGHKVGRPSNRLTFHQSHLKITACQITHHDKSGDQIIKIDRINHHKKFDEVRLHSNKPFYGGQYIIRLDFIGKITRSMNGLYPCFYEDDGTKKELLGTQFESHHAREVFPCIDEPEAKSTFDLTLNSPADELAISNMPIKNQQTTQSGLITEFEQTPHMSTYLLAFVVGELSYKEAKTKQGVVVRTYATKHNIEFTEFALEIAVKMLDFYNDYFGINYPLPKCDLAALPDFAAGAMENWGLITFREHALLVDPANTSVGSKQYVAMVVAHELAHQWFGNLVTMRWWTDLWLNEGFASWIEYLAVDHLFPEWQMWTQFMVEEQQPALKMDALEHTHPIVMDINDPNEIRSIFDAISYNKGSSVIQMLHEYLGKDVFRDGLRHYLQTHKYNNTNTIDLWSALETISGKPVKQFMNSWTDRAGYPIIKANISEQTITLSQERFYSNPTHSDEASETWPIPLLSGHSQVPEQLDKTHFDFEIKDSGNLKFNQGSSGFYRVVYNATHLNRLGELIHRGKIGPVDRLGILSDSFEAAKAGYIATIDALALLEKFEHEDNSAVWEVMAANLGGIRMVMDNDKLREAMKPYTRQLVETQLSRLGWQTKSDESHFDRLLRPTILGLASVSDETKVVERALKLFKTMHQPEDISADLRQTPSRSQFRSGTIDPDLRGVVYGTVARIGDKTDFNKLLDMHNATQSAEERLNLTAALTGFKQPALIKQALDLIKTDTVRLQDITYWVAYSFMNRHAKLSTWDWMVENWDWLKQNMGSDMSFYRFPIYSARSFSDLTFLKTYKQFFAKHNQPGMDRSINQGIEIIEWQAAWKERDLKLIKAYFKVK